MKKTLFTIVFVSMIMLTPQFLQVWASVCGRRGEAVQGKCDLIALPDDFVGESETLNLTLGASSGEDYDDIDFKDVMVASSYTRDYAFSAAVLLTSLERYGRGLEMSLRCTPKVDRRQQAPCRVPKSNRLCGHDVHIKEVVFAMQKCINDQKLILLWLDATSLVVGTFDLPKLTFHDILFAKERANSGNIDMGINMGIMLMRCNKAVFDFLNRILGFSRIGGWDQGDVNIALQTGADTSYVRQYILSNLTFVSRSNLKWDYLPSHSFQVTKGSALYREQNGILKFIGGRKQYRRYIQAQKIKGEYRRKISKC